MKLNSLVRMNKDFFRVLSTEGNELLVINCNGRGSPVFLSYTLLKGLPTASECEMQEYYDVDFKEKLTASKERECNERYSIISPILPFISIPAERYRAIGNVAEEAGISRRTVKRYLNHFLAYQDRRALLSKNSIQRNNSKHDVNFRWALNKYYFTRHGKSIADTYTMLLKERYCDETGALLPTHPTLNQFRYYFRNHRSLQTEIISRNGLKDYQMNCRPLLGESVQKFAPCVGTAMLDSTVCDIYLCDAYGNVVGRPVLTVAIDAYSSMCLGYSLAWEGGMYSIRNLFTNVLSDKVKLCRKFGILISKEDWNCTHLPAKLVTDKGAEFTSMNLEQLAELGVQIINLPAFRPELKGPVEKFFDLIQKNFKHSLQGRGVIESDFAQRGGHDYRKDACLTLKDFEKIVIHAIIYYNTKRIIGNFPYSQDMLIRQILPHANAIWNYGKKQPGANLLDIGVSRLVATLLPRAIGTFSRRGLLINGLRYHCDGIVEEYLSGGKALVAYNPDDVSEVYLVEREYQKFTLIDSRFNAKSLVEVTTLKRMQKALVKSCAEDNLQGRIDLARHVETIAAANRATANVNLKDMRNTRTIERALNHKDFTKEAVNG